MADDKDILNNNESDPTENHKDSGHLPVSGEAGIGPVSYHDPLTTDTYDNPDNAEDDADLDDVIGFKEKKEKSD